MNWVHCLIQSYHKFWNMVTYLTNTDVLCWGQKLSKAKQTNANVKVCVTQGWLKSAILGGGSSYKDLGLSLGGGSSYKEINPVPEAARNRI